MCQIVAIIVSEKGVWRLRQMESCRLVTIELVLKDVRPLQSITLYAPVSLCFKGLD